MLPLDKILMESIQFILYALHNGLASNWQQANTETNCDENCTYINVYRNFQVAMF